MGRITLICGEKYLPLWAIVNLLFIIDSISIIFTKRKRALHDLIARTYVVSKASVEETVKSMLLTSLRVEERVKHNFI